MALRWFRFGKKQDMEAAQEAVATEEVQASLAERLDAELLDAGQLDADSPEAGQPDPGQLEAGQDGSEPVEGTGQARKRRRRGSRGGRGRKKPAVGAAAAAPAEEPETPPEPKRGRPERKQERRAGKAADRHAARGTRRRTATRRAALPDAKRELLISVDVGEQRVAILEDDLVAEVYLERPERRSIAGNIYLGVVDNVLPGMEAAFVEIGLEKNGFLYVDEIVGPELEGRKGAKKIQDLIRRGETVLVQAVKDPMKSKGARLTTEISLPGRFLVYVPNGEGSGVSRRLDDHERQRLKDIVKELDAKGGGIIVRTAAEGASAEDIERDLVFLQRLWKTIQTKTKNATAPSLVYEEAELPLRIVRDLFAGDFVGARIDDDRTYRRIVSYLKKTSPHMVERVHRYRDKAPLFEASGVEKEIRSTLERRVNLPSGGYLIFDYAEAFTVIDVNTGRFVGSRGKSSGGRLEDTIVKNNLEAVKEVVRQLRLRDIGGIIVIDFIDMSNPKNRETVEAALRTELERDRTKTYVVEISPLGLVEMTRQNVTDGPREILTRKCPVCEGDGFVVSEQTMALEVERKLRALAAGSRVQGFRVAVHPRTLSLLVGPGGTRLEAIEAAARRRFFLVPADGHIHLDHVEVLGQGKLEAVRPQAPVEEGQTVDVKLVEVGLHDPAAGVGKLDDYEIVVADASKLVGKKVSVSVGRALEHAAFATLAEAAGPDGRITFEAEAEKPTRATASTRKKAPARADKAAVAEPVEATPEDEVADAEEPSADAAAGSDQPKKKRARRGTRGGRARKKPPAGAAPASANGQEGRAVPTIHVPPADLGDQQTTEQEPAEPEEVGPETGEPESGEPEAGGEPKKKRTRRGTRGGRRRRKPSANGQAVDGGGQVSEEVAGEDAAPEEQAEPSEDGYVPMSEWIEDFDARNRPPQG